jgi:hypothetical protein
MTNENWMLVHVCHSGIKSYLFHRQYRNSVTRNLTAILLTQSLSLLNLMIPFEIRLIRASFSSENEYGFRATWQTRWDPQIYRANLSGLLGWIFRSTLAWAGNLYFHSIIIQQSTDNLIFVSFDHDVVFSCINGGGSANFNHNFHYPTSLRAIATWFTSKTYSPYSTILWRPFPKVCFLFRIARVRYATIVQHCDLSFSIIDKTVFDYVSM